MGANDIPRPVCAGVGQVLGGHYFHLNGAATLAAFVLPTWSARKQGKAP